MNLESLNLQTLWTTDQAIIDAQNRETTQQLVNVNCDREIALGEAALARLKANYDGDVAQMKLDLQVSHSENVARARGAFREAVTTSPSDFNFQSLMNAVSLVDNTSDTAAAQQALEEAKKAYDAKVADIKSRIEALKKVKAAFNPGTDETAA